MKIYSCIYAVHWTIELRYDRISSGVENTTSILVNRGFDNFSAGFYAFKGPDLVFNHQGAVAYTVSG